MQEKPNLKMVGKRVSIPSEDIWQWQRTLEKGGFTFEEIDKILSPMNSDYSWAKINARVEEIIKESIEEIQRNGEKMTLVKREEFADAVRKRFKRQIDDELTKK